MNISLLDLVICPSCHKDSLRLHAFTLNNKDVSDGVLVCSSCRLWYIIEEGILELIVPALNSTRRTSFFHKHTVRMKKLSLKLTSSSTIGKQTQSKIHQSEFFDDFSDSYVLETLPFWRAYYYLVLEHFKRSIERGSVILDIGCGNGLGTVPFFDGHYTVVGVDISRSMVKDAIKRLHLYKKSKGHFFIADAENLPFKNNIFDASIGLGILHHVTSPQHTLQQISRCLKKGASYFGHENNKTILRPIFDLLMKVFTLWHEEAGDHQLISSKELHAFCNTVGMSTQIDTKVYLPPHFFNFFTISMATKLLRISNSFFSSIPFVKTQGGTLVFTATKR